MRLFRQLLQLEKIENLSGEKNPGKSSKKKLVTANVSLCQSRNQQ